MAIDRRMAGMAAAGLIVALAALRGVGPVPQAAAQIVCRPNGLGAETCMGLPAPSARSGQPFTLRGRGLSGVQPPISFDAGPALTPARRTDTFGNTFLTQSDLPPRRPPLPGVAPVRNCRRDGLGNLLCD